MESDALCRMAEVSEMLASMSNDWPFEIGNTLPRKQVHAKVGGQEQQGIVTPRGWPDVLVFTDPVKGKRFGYDRFEGLRADGCYSYTGAGRQGDQVFLRGNKWLRDAGGLCKSLV